MFYKGQDSVYRVSELDRFGWLEHGFGTRLSPNFATTPDVVTVRQIHSDLCLCADGRAGCLGEGDAILGATPGYLYAVKTADCLPILLADERTRAVAAIHAGWRGTLREIARKAVENLSARFDAQPPDLHAAIGPAIGGCCFEVDAEIAELLGQAGRGKLDLIQINRQQLLQAGLRPDRIYVAGLCTMCRPEEFHSYRRDRQAAGRMRSAVGIKSVR